MRLNHNTLAYTANNNLTAVNNNLTKAMERLSSGYKINKSSDDAAGHAISQRMRSQIRGLQQANNNANDGVSLIQTAEGALNEIHSILERIRELAVKGANETYAEEDLDAMQDEIDQLLSEIDRISNTTDFNGRKLLNGELNKKGYTNNDGLKVTEIGGDIEPGKYGLTITSAGTQASMNLQLMANSEVLSAEQSGTISINGFEITLTAGMTGDAVNARIREAADKIGIDFDETTGTMTTREYGSKQYLHITCDNDTLAGKLNINGSTTVYGTDAVVDFQTDANGRIGFRDTAGIETQGNRITVTDKDGFQMIYDIQPEVTAGFSTTITVLSAGPMVLQIGNNEGQTLNVNINKTTSASLNIDTINVYTHAYASEAVERLDDAVAKLSNIRSSLGAYQNRLDHIVTNLESAEENLTSAVSRISDTDMAEEITEYTQMNVLSQSALQMLIKSNARPEGLLQLFQR